MLPCKVYAGSVDVAGSCPYLTPLAHTELTWRAPEGIHGPLQLAVKVKAVHCINLCLQALHLVHQGVHVGIRLPHRNADLAGEQESACQQLQTCCSSTPNMLFINSKHAVHQRLHIGVKLPHCLADLRGCRPGHHCCLTTWASTPSSCAASWMQGPIYSRRPTSSNSLTICLTGSSAGWMLSNTEAESSSLGSWCSIPICTETKQYTNLAALLGARAAGGCLQGVGQQWGFLVRR